MPFYTMPAPQYDPGLPGALGQALMYMAQGYGRGLERTGRQKEMQQDLTNLMSFLQTQQQLTDATQLHQGLMGLSPEQRQTPGLPIPQWPTHMGVPQFQTPGMGQALAGRMIQGAMPTPLEQARTGYYERAGRGEPSPLTPEEQREMLLFGKREREKPELLSEKERREIALYGQRKRAEEEPRYKTPTIATEGDELGLRPGTLTQIGPRGKMEIIYEPPITGLDPKEKLQLGTILRKEFNQGQAFKDFQTIDRSEKSMKRAYLASIDPKTKSKVASDQALAVLFQKMLDPTSVVRESEYARTPEGIAAVNRIMAFLPQLRKGGLAITDEDRKALYNMAQKLLDEAKMSLNKHIDRYAEISDLYGISRKLVFGNIRKFDLIKEPAEINLPTERDPLGLGF